jgi:hypothetical protein
MVSDLAMQMHCRNAGENENPAKIVSRFANKGPVMKGVAFRHDLMMVSLDCSVIVL